MASNLFSVSTEGSLINSAAFWSISAILLALLAWNLFKVPSSLYRPSSVKPYRSTLPALGPIQLYSERNTFLRTVFGNPEEWNINPPKQNSVRVNARRHIMTITNNPLQDGKTFFNDRGLDFNTAYEVMFAGIPELPSWLAKTPPAEDAGSEGFVSNLRQSLSSARLQSNLPEMVKAAVDVFKAMPASNGEIDIHQTIYPLVFQISVLFVGMAEHARDINTVKAMEAPFWSFADNTGYMATHFPLLPVPSTVRKWIGAIKMSTAIRTTLETRKKEGRREKDYIQEMIDRGCSPKAIEDFIMGGLFAAIINTTGVASWLLVFLCAQPELRDRVRAEFDGVFRKAAEERGEDYDSLTLQEKLERTPLENWEGDLPLYETVVDETLRILMISLVFRRKLKTPSKVTHGETKISEDNIQDREFIAFWLGSAHRNANIYSDPLTFDPSRFERGEGKGEGEFVPWGAGRHVCLGMRFAKLEIRTVHAAFLVAFPDTRTTDGKGTAYGKENVPYPDQESEHRRYPTKPTSLSYKTNTLAK
ncbi:hypothetical protein NDA11_005421 [Ustilago hordei]|uniref:Cytochrome P450 n=1 Tax=Ustilago hordei TaxID=120017 RepID=I2FX64_USTHO|nr:uncharacterized protein UHO2_04353 [Ustilago hordei]KAJ1036974.1 hypothetical protein NDA10_007958 [Ustilago hordei]KAJ1573755.1 hypothetical protein NDA15_003039 [Ustilago hordei]KAJ1579392.1 hypothetical protein NDA11_005421 [Ustilago hordei]KAJ1579732.1 hypothetical protein NDA12_005927 [Ustilago hordei]KAJ1598650.1 hypothetical protein NDA14_005918 [Ustilago hordei]